MPRSRSFFKTNAADRVLLAKVVLSRYFLPTSWIVLTRHFNLPGHTVDDIRIQPIEHITQSPGETEQNVTIRRLDRERFWMLELGTMYPYGLNDRLQHVGNVSQSYVRSRNNVFNLFNRHQRHKRSHGRRSNSRRNSEITLDQLRNLYNGGRSHGRDYIVFELLFIAPGYQIYINYLMNVNG